MIVLLDSTTLVDLLKSRRSQSPTIDDLTSAGHTAATSAINIAEIYAGMRRHEAERTRALFAGLEI